MSKLKEFEEKVKNSLRWSEERWEVCRQDIPDLLKTMLVCLSREEVFKHQGICGKWIDSPEYGNLPFQSQIVTEKMLFEIMGSWPHHSGSKGFPVPPPAGSTEGVTDIFYNCHNLWTGEYGESRKDLLRHCIRELGVLINVYI